MEYQIKDNTILINADKLDILTVSDLHLRTSNFKGRKDYPGEVLGYLEDIRDVVYRDNIDILLMYGDIFDNHFTEDGALQYFNRASTIFKEISDKALIVTLMGNHELHNYRTTPFFSITDILSDRIKADLKAILYNPVCISPLLYAPDRLILNDKIIIELFHFSDINKSYKVEPLDNYDYIGIYHDAIISTKASSYIKSAVGEAMYTHMCEHMIKVDVEDSIFSYLKYACIGDIHTRVGEFKIGDCIVDMPGAVGRTQYTILQGHTVVDLPKFHIENNIITKTHESFNLLDIGQSYKVNVLDMTKETRIESKKFKKALEKITFTKDIRRDIENANINDNIKTILVDALESKQGIESINSLNEFLNHNENIGRS